MKTHKSIPHAVMPTGAVQVEGSAGTMRPDAMVRAARGMVILFLLVGSVSAESMAASGHGSDHAGAHQSAGSVHRGAGAHRPPMGIITNRPWMY